MAWNDLAADAETVKAPNPQAFTGLVDIDPEDGKMKTARGDVARMLLLRLNSASGAVAGYPGGGPAVLDRLAALAGAGGEYAEQVGDLLATSYRAVEYLSRLNMAGDAWDELRRVELAKMKEGVALLAQTLPADLGVSSGSDGMGGTAGGVAVFRI